MEADGLFIYGTLREGGSHHAWLQRTGPEGLCAAWVPGRLFHLPLAGYPALIAAPEPSEAPPGPGWITGTFVGYPDETALEAALQDLDQLEDVDGDLFERRILPVRLEGGQRYLAWVYLFPPDRLLRLEREAIEVPGGDWCDYLEG